MIISLPKKAPAYSLADPTFLLKHMKEKKMSSYLTSNNNGVENHFVVREVVMAFESAFTKANRHSPVNTIRSPIL